MSKDFSGILIASDIDGTFLDRHSGRVQRNYDAIEYFKAHGGKFTFATGRYENFIESVVPDFWSLINVPGIYTNGAYIYDHISGKKIYKQCMDGRFTLDILNEVIKRYPNLEDVRYTCEKGVIRLNDGKPKPVEDYDWYKVVIVGDSKDLDEIREYVRRRSGDYFAFSKSCEVIFEMLHFDATKGTMLRRLKSYLHEHGTDITTYAIGDYENDFDMLSKADVSVCPSNALGMIKDICDIKVCSNDDGAIADLIYKIEEAI